MRGTHSQLFGRWGGASICALLLLVGCGREAPVVGSIAVGDPCDATDECEPGSVCQSGICRHLCNTDSDCPGKTESCADGVCSPVQNPECAADADCTAAPPCNDVAGALCRGGLCSFSPATQGAVCDDDNACTTDDQCDSAGVCSGTQIACATPPANECLGGDTVYRDYADIGACDAAAGACVYDHQDTNCANCTTTCLGVCATVVCNNTNGGCRGSGFCNPTLSPPACEYSIIAADATACMRPQDTTIPRGVCASGRCIDCLDASACTNPPGAAPICYDSACVGEVCVYTVDTNRECQAARCVNGSRTAAQLCNATGSCPSGTGVSCGGFACNSDGVTCKSTCADDSDCVTGLQCDTGACLGRLPDGSACNGGSDCISNYCQNSICCAGGACCLSDAGCGPCEKCSGQSECVLQSSGEDLKNECNPDAGCGSGNCDGAGACDFTAAGTEGGCPTCEDCDGAGVCSAVAPGQTDIGCDAVATSCSGAATCDGAGSCQPNHLAAGDEGSCVTCEDCDGAGACATIPDGQSDAGCDTSQSCASNDYYYISGNNADAAVTKDCTLRAYTAVTDNCQAGSCSTPACTAYGDALQSTAGVCQYFGGCSGSTAPTVQNFSSGTSCGAGLTCDGNGNCLGVAVVVTSVFNESCATTCANLAKACVSVGLDASAIDTAYWCTDGVYEPCASCSGATCAHVFSDIGSQYTGICGGSTPEWAYCRCQ